jgi:hypothetical protein
MNVNRLRVHLSHTMNHRYFFIAQIVRWFIIKRLEIIQRGSVGNYTKKKNVILTAPLQPRNTSIFSKSKG